MYTCSSFKMMARLSMRNTKYRVYITSAIYIAVITIMNYLINRILGIDSFVESYYVYVERGIMPDYNTLLNMLPKPEIWEVLLALLLSFMINFLGIGFAGYCLKVSRGQETRVSDLMCGFEFFGRAFAILVLRTVFVALWSMLFIVPGIIAAFRYSQSYYIMFDNPDMPAYECIKRSGGIMRGFKGFYFVLMLSFILWYFLNSLMVMYVFVPIVLVFLTPYEGITYAHFYNARTGYMPPPPGQENGGNPFNM